MNLNKGKTSMVTDNCGLKSHNEFLEKLIKVQSLPYGNPAQESTLIGPIINGKQV